MVHWMLWMLLSSHCLKIDSYHSNMRGLLTTSPIWSGVGGFVGIMIIFSPMDWMCMIWFNMHLFSWRLVLIMSLSLRDVMACTLLHFNVICRINMYSKTCWAVVGYFLPTLRIQTVVLFLYVNACLYGIVFFDWEIYDMMWYSQYCVTMPMGVPLGGKLILTSNI